MAVGYSFACLDIPSLPQHGTSHVKYHESQYTGGKNSYVQDDILLELHKYPYNNYVWPLFMYRHLTCFFMLCE